MSQQTGAGNRSARSAASIDGESFPEVASKAMEFRYAAHVNNVLIRDDRDDAT